MMSGHVVRTQASDALVVVVEPGCARGIADPPNREDAHNNNSSLLLWNRILRTARMRTTTIVRCCCGLRTETVRAQGQMAAVAATLGSTIHAVIDVVVVYTWHAATNVRMRVVAGGAAGRPA